MIIRWWMWNYDDGHNGLSWWIIIMQFPPRLLMNSLCIKEKYVGFNSRKMSSRCWLIFLTLQTLMKISITLLSLLYGYKTMIMKRYEMIMINMEYVRRWWWTVWWMNEWWMWNYNTITNVIFYLQNFNKI